MSNLTLIPPKEDNSLAVQAQTAQTVNLQTGNNAKQIIGDVGAINTTIVYVSANGEYPQQMNLSKEYCNIFVVESENFNSNSFMIRKDRSLKKFITDEIKERFSNFDCETAEEIYTFPSLFMDRNHAYKKCRNPNQQCYFGKVTNITEQGYNYKVCFQKLSPPLMQQRLNEIAEEIGINTGTRYDSLDETHWSIKKMNLQALMFVLAL